MNLLVSKRSWRLSPLVFVICLSVLVAAWALAEPKALRHFFDDAGRSFFETMTVALYSLIVPTVWIMCPFTGGFKRKALLSGAVTLVIVAAIMKQLDLHIDALEALYPEAVSSFKGTPFKMRFLRDGSMPFGAKLWVVAFLFSLFGIFALLLLRYARALLEGVRKFHPVAWTVGCLGASGVLVQVFDRLPAWVRHSIGCAKSEMPLSFTSFCTVLEEGSEMMIAFFALIAIVQAHLLYCNDGEKYDVGG